MRPHRLRPPAAGALALVLLAFSGCAYHLHPDDVFTYEAAPFEAGKVALPEGWTLAPMRSAGLDAVRVRGPAPAGTLLYFNGNGGTAQRALELLLPRALRLRLDLVVLDYRPRGRPAPTVAGVRQAATALLDEAVAEGRPVWVGGHSLGCWFALDLLRRGDVAGGFLLAPGTTAADVGESVAGAPLRWFVRLRPDEDVAWLDAEALARAARAPVLLFGSTGDKVMLPAFQERILAALPQGEKRLVVLEGVTHGGYLRSERVWEELEGFLRPRAR
jgi:pimeloyl-ACP methyl ester carboxylesterase